MSKLILADIKRTVKRDEDIDIAAVFHQVRDSMVPRTVIRAHAGTKPGVARPFPESPSVPAPFRTSLPR